MKSACATIKGFEVLRMIRKRQCIGLEPEVAGEVRFLAKLFGVPARRSRSTGDALPRIANCNRAWRASLDRRRAARRR
jgi:hypothetical protein